MLYGGEDESRYDAFYDEMPWRDERGPQPERYEGHNDQRVCAMCLNELDDDEKGPLHQVCEWEVE